MAIIRKTKISLKAKNDLPLLSTGVRVHVNDLTYGLTLSFGEVGSPHLVEIHFTEDETKCIKNYVTSQNRL
jgi:hypothetical protein